MSKALHAALFRLLETANGQLPSSLLTQSQRKALNEFCIQTRSVSQVPRGRGSIYQVALREVVERHLSEMAPLALADQAFLSSLPQRASNIGLSRSSKGGQHSHDLHYLLLRAAGAGPAIWKREDGASIDIQQAVRQQGAAVLTIGDSSLDDWVSDTPLWLVENQALFDRLDWLPETLTATVAWYSGHLRNNLLHWLAQRPRASSITLFPDYDGVGLQNYARLVQRTQQPVEFWLMPDWETKLKRFGNNRLWQDTASDFQAAITTLLPRLQPDAPLRAMINRMQSLGLALEQEAIWLEATDANSGADA